MKKYTVFFGAFIGVILVLLSLLSPGPTDAHLASQVTVTPTAFNYLPFVAKNWPPTPTPTATPTATPIPGSTRLWLCGSSFWDLWLSTWGCPGKTFSYPLYPGVTWSWTETLTGDISGVFGYGLRLRSTEEESMTLELRVIHKHNGVSDTLTSSSINVDTAAITRYSGSMTASNPIATEGDKLFLEIEYVSGGEGVISFGDSDYLDGGSYLDLVYE